MNAPKTVSEFLAFLQPDSRFLLVAIHPDTGDITAESFTDYPQAEAWALDWNGKGRNCYYTVNLAKPMDKKASKRDIKSARAFWADADPDVKTHGSYLAAREHLLNGPLSEMCAANPTIIVDSGNGLQPLFLLKHPVGLNGYRGGYEDINARIGAKFHGPGTFNCDRILRLPFTRNYPNAVKLAKGYPDNPSMARVVDCSGIRYTEEEIKRLCRSKFDDFLERNPKAKARWGGSTEGLTDTSGSAMDFSMAAMLKGAGFSRGEMKEILTDWPHGSEGGKQQGARYFDRLWERCGQGTDDSESQGQNSETIAWLAKLSTEEYEGKRRDEAKGLNWRVGVLDKAVEKARVKLWAERRAAEQAECQQEEEQPILCPDLGQDDHLVLVDQAIRDLGYGGDTKLPRLLYLSYTSRLLAFDIGNMLAHGQVVGPPSSGKNYAVDTVLALMPVDAYLKIDAGSPRALIYYGGDLRYRIVVFTEADSLPIGEGGGKSFADGDSRSTAASALRNLASGGYLSYDIVERDPDTGQFVTRHIKKDGPTLLLTTTTKAIGGQMGTRLWEVHMLESDEQIRVALDKRVLFELTRQQSIPETLIAYQRYLQSKAPWDVIVPFVRELKEGIVYQGMDPRILRDFQRLLALIKAATLLRHQRRKQDKNGRWIATIEDYAAVREVLNESYAVTVNSGITEDVRKVVDEVEAFRAKGVLIHDFFT